MPTFLIVALLTYGAMHAYALAKVARAHPDTRGLRPALALAGVALTTSPLLVWALERQGWPRAAGAAAAAAYAWMGYLFLFVCIGPAIDAAQALLRLAGRAALGHRAALHTVALLALAALGHGLLEARTLRVERLHIASPKLAGRPITIAQVSDMHLGAMAGAETADRVTDVLRELKPDIVVATGDIVDGQGDDLDTLALRLRAYTPPLGAYAVLGNHEHYAGQADAMRFLQRAGFTVLRGEAARAGGVVFVGIDEGGKVPPPGAIGPGEFVVLLRHQPVVDPAMPFDLQLSGHTHGGQIFPFGLLTRLVYHVHSGLNELPDGRRLYVSRGAGTWGPPVRVLAGAEVTVVRVEGG